MNKSRELLESPKAERTTTWSVKTSVMVGKSFRCASNGQSAAKLLRNEKKVQRLENTAPMLFIVMGDESPRVRDISLKEMMI